MLTVGSKMGETKWGTSLYLRRLKLPANNPIPPDVALIRVWFSEEHLGGGGGRFWLCCNVTGRPCERVFHAYLEKINVQVRAARQGAARQ